MLADHVGERLARRGLAQQLAGARRPGLAEREAGLGLDEVARIALVDELRERGTGLGVVHELAERASDRAARARMDLAAQPLDQAIARERRCASVASPAAAAPRIAQNGSVE